MVSIAIIMGKVGAVWVEGNGYGQGSAQLSLAPAAVCGRRRCFPTVVPASRSLATPTGSCCPKAVWPLLTLTFLVW